MVEHIAEQSAAIKLLQQGIVYQKVKWNYMKKYIYICTVPSNNIGTQI